MIVTGDTLPDISCWNDEFPSHLLAETSILGAILLDNEALAQTVTLEPDEFALSSNQLIFHTMREMGKAIDIVTLSNVMAGTIINDNAAMDLPPYRLIDDIGGVAYLASLTEGMPWHLNLDDYVAIVKEKAKLRRIIGACEKAIRLSKEQSDPAAEIVKRLGDDLKGISTRKAKP